MLVRRIVSCALVSIPWLLSVDAALATHGGDSAEDVRAAALATAAVGAGTALERVDAALYGVGRDYKAEFSADGFRYTTRLGPVAPRAGALAFELDSIRLGDAMLLDDAPAIEPTWSDRTVTYARGADIHEQYHVRADGIEQSFVFDALPEPRGELVVRGRITTEMVVRGVDGSPAHGTHVDGLRFESPGHGSFVYGGVTGIDAGGRTARGELRFDGEWLELALPAAFVAEATLPLVLDPLLGSNVTLYSDSAVQPLVDLAYDATHDLYLVVWTVSSFLGSDDVLGQRIRPDGSAVGGLLLIEANDGFYPDGEPTVANNNGSNRFLVAWPQGPSALGAFNDLACRIVDASTGALSNTLLFATNGSQLEAGGEALVGYPNVQLVWRSGAHEIRGASLAVPGIGDVSQVTHYLVASSPSEAGDPSISKSGGIPGRYLVTWSETSPENYWQIRARTVSYNGVPGPEAPVDVSAGDGVQAQTSVVDGDGVDFAVAYWRASGTPPGDVFDLVCRRVTWAVGGLTVLPGSTPMGANIDVSESIDLDLVAVGGSVASTGEPTKYALAWSESSGPGVRIVRYRELDPGDGSHCGSPVTVVDTHFNAGVALASEVVGGASGVTDRGMLAFVQYDTSTGFVVVRPFEALGAGGSIVDLGGGCAGGGTASTVGPFAIGNPAFRFELTGASPIATLALHNLGVGAAHFPCGACTGFIGFLNPVPVTLGSASLTLAIPCDPALIGVPVDHNWIVLPVPTTPCPAFPNVANSNILRLTIGE